MKCDKFGHPTKADAMKNMHKIWRQRRGPRKLPTRAYLCPHCQKWHLTSQPKKERKSV